VKPFVVYMLKCSDGSYYAGHTDDLDARMRSHQDGKQGYTATRRPLELEWAGEFETREQALAFEVRIKGWSRAKKEALAKGDWDEVQRLARSRGAETGLRQAQPERSRADRRETLHNFRLEPLEGMTPTQIARPEPVEGAPTPQGLRQAQPERKGGGRPEHPSTVPPEPVEGPAPTQTVRPEPVEGQAPTETVRPEPVEGPLPDPLLPDLLHGDPPRRRRAIAKAITLLESTRTDHRARADELLNALLPHTGRSFRLGISGVPGVGKSTFIEALGLHLIAQGHRVAVLAVDPSSSVSGGSILGDKTRMEHLSVHESAYIRPSPSSGTLGGVAERTRESLLVCEAAGYDIVIVETVGVGQSETAVAGMTDMFVLMQLPNAGDDLQAIKKGVMELADLVVINKADLDEAAATRARAQITSALRLFGLHGHPDHAHHDATAWHPKVLQLSALKSVGVDSFWRAVSEYRQLQARSGRLATRRHAQDEAWMWERIDAGLKSRFRSHPAVREQLPALRSGVREGTLAASVAARRLLDLFQ
jgi:LAO/AO transport system kinase